MRTRRSVEVVTVDGPSSLEQFHPKGKRILSAEVSTKTGCLFIRENDSTLMIYNKHEWSTVRWVVTPAETDTDKT